MYKNICIFFIIGFFLFVLYNFIYEQCIKYKEGHENPEDIHKMDSNIIKNAGKVKELTTKVTDVLNKINTALPLIRKNEKQLDTNQKKLAKIVQEAQNKGADKEKEMEDAFKK